MPAFLEGALAKSGVTMLITIRNWSKFQHYRDRKPPWLKLHRDLLDNMQWAALSGDAGKLLISLWLLAAEGENGGGTVDLDSKALAWRLRSASKPEEMDKLLQELMDNEFVLCASKALATCQQHATTETEGETETEGDLDSPPAPPEPKPKPKKKHTFKTWTAEDFNTAITDANYDGLLTSLEAKDFFDYWTEPTDTGRFRLATERTWDTRRRMQNAVRIVYSKRRIDDRPRRVENPI